MLIFVCCITYNLFTIFSSIINTILKNNKTINNTSNKIVNFIGRYIKIVNRLKISPAPFQGAGKRRLFSYINSIPFKLLYYIVVIISKIK